MWLKLLACLALLHSLAALPSQHLGKIFGGKTALVGDYPFLVILRRDQQFKCGGALISPNCVLTAAHCLEIRHQNVQDIFVHAQQQCLGKAYTQKHVRQAWYAWVSPQYFPERGLDSDIAVIKLRKSFDIPTDARTLQIDFNEVPNYANLTVMGWGMTNNNYQYWNQCLQVTNVSRVPQQQCIQKLSKFHPITENMFCALGANATDACSGDSGGPILYNGRTVGIVSWGYGCGSNYPGVYTRLSSSTMSWGLKSFVEKHCLV